MLETSDPAVFDFFHQQFCCKSFFVFFVYYFRLGASATQKVEEIGMASRAGIEHAIATDKVSFSNIIGNTAKLMFNRRIILGFNCIIFL